jgi:hypothetical protein
VEEAMNVHHDRRDAKASRIPFEAIVEIGGELAPGAAFEAQSVDLSVSGMHLRTAYLPEIGRPLLCRFGSGAEDISAEAEVVWRREEARGGDFGVRFTNLDGASAAALCQMCGLAAGEPNDPEAGGTEAEPGTRVRLHIDGLGSPMKARVRGATDSELLVGSNLEFLRVGRTLELEDVDRGGKRPAHIDRVDIEIDRDSQVPQLVVTLRYDDLDAASGGAGKGSAAKDRGSKATGASPASGSASSEQPNAALLVPSRTMAEIRRRYELARAKWTASGVVRAARRAGSSMSRWRVRAHMTAALLWGKIVEHSVGAQSAQARRMTSPPPTGALHATGKRVVREAAEESDEKDRAPKRLGGGKRAIVMAMCTSAVGLVVLVVILARKPHPMTAPLSLPPDTNTVTPGDPATTAIPGTNAGAVVASPDNQAAASTAAPPHVEPVDDTKPTATPSGGSSTAPLVPTFGYGKVSHAVIVQVKLDGAISTLRGARASNGFTVVVPGRRTLDSPALLSRADPRLAAVKVANRPKGTELMFEFRGEVPSYLVRARGDRLQVALGPSDASPSRSPVATRTSGVDHVRTDERHRLTRPEPTDLHADVKDSPASNRH